MTEQNLPVFPSLTNQICGDLNAWSDPMGQGVLAEEGVAEIVAALTIARAEAQSTAARLPRAEALDYMAVEQALLAAVSLVEAVHLPSS
ncbi:MAG: hypothetical protein EOO28_25290 [Comamonadaceae bacterium]|nr:MAG: hypothetical protein EOO28_25290 [Comamonadaceae bacterium]